MSKPVLIEIRGEPRGIVTPSGGGYRFVAVRLEAFALDGQWFSGIAEARHAVGVAVRAHEEDMAAQHSAA